MNTKTTFCGDCRALRWVEDWNETRDEMLAIVLGPCGHVIERTARVEWGVPTERDHSRIRLIRATPEREGVAPS